MKTITRDYITNKLSKENPPCDRIRAGEVVAFETYDCFTNQFLPQEATFENVVRKPGNPATGPLYIEGAMPGDMLKIDILDIEMGPVGIVMLGPDSGSEKEEFPRKVLRRVPVKGGYAYFNEKVKIPIKPMIGVIGVAPGRRGSLHHHSHEPWRKYGLHPDKKRSIPVSACICGGCSFVYGRFSRHYGRRRGGGLRPGNRRTGYRPGERGAK